MSSSKANTLVDVTNNQAKDDSRKSTRNGGHANINLSEKAMELRNNEQALALEQSVRSRKPSSSVGGSKQSSKKQKPNGKGGNGSGKGSHKNSQQNIKEHNKDYRAEEGTEQERFVKVVALSLKKKKDSLKNLDARVKVKLIDYGTGYKYISVTHPKGLSEYLKYDDVMDLLDRMTTDFGCILHSLSSGYFGDDRNRRDLLSDDNSELIFIMKPRVNGKLTVLDLATLTDAKLATITGCRGKEKGQHAAKAKSLPQVEFVVGDNEPLTSQREAVALLKGGANVEKGQLLKDMRLKIAKEFKKNPHAFMKDINTTAIKDTWTGTTGRGKNAQVISTQVVIRFSRPFTRENFR